MVTLNKGPTEENIPKTSYPWLVDTDSVMLVWLPFLSALLRPDVFPATLSCLSGSFSFHSPRRESCSRVWWLFPVLQFPVQLTDKISPNLAFSWRTVFPACFILYITSRYTMFSVCYYGYYAQKQFFLICMCLPEHLFLKNREN